MFADEKASLIQIFSADDKEFALLLRLSGERRWVFLSGSGCCSTFPLQQVSLKDGLLALYQ